MDSQTFSSEALPELETLSKMSAPGKVNMSLGCLNECDNIIVIGSNLCSKDVIQCDSFSFIFLIIYFGLYYIFITLLFWIDLLFWLTQKEGAY